MPSCELERVAADLSSIREAMRLGKPYTWDDVNLDLVTALSGLLSMLLILFSPLSAKMAFMLGLLPGLLYYLRFTAKQRSRRAVQPRPWKEAKLTLKALLIVVPLIAIWLLWSGFGGSREHHGGGTSTITLGNGTLSVDGGTLSVNGTGATGHRETIGPLASAAALYFMGVGLGVLGIIDPNRRRYLAGSAVLIAYGMASPLLTPQQMILGAAVALMAGGLLSAAITFFQLKFDSELPDKGELAS